MTRTRASLFDAESIVLARLKAALTGVVVIDHAEEPPDTDPGIDPPPGLETDPYPPEEPPGYPERWCRLANAVASTLGRNGADDGGHQQTVAFSITVSASARTQRDDPARVARDAEAVAAALDGHTATRHGTTLMIHTVTPEHRPGDLHARHRVMVVTAVGLMQR